MNIKHIIFAILTPLLCGCTILDNDLRDLPDVPGYTETVHEETEDYVLDYQYQPEVRYVDNEMLSYVTAIDSTYTHLSFYDHTPGGKLPKVGDLLASKSNDKLPYGLGHRVTSVQSSGGLYVLGLERAMLDDIYLTYVAESHMDDLMTDEDDVPDDAFEIIDADEAREAIQGIKTRAEGSVKSEFDPINITIEVKKAAKDNEMSKAVSIKGDFDGKLTIELQPIVQNGTVMDTDNKKVDIKLNTGLRIDIIFEGEGGGVATVDFAKIAEIITKKELKLKHTFTIGALPVTFSLKPVLNFKTELSGKVGFYVSKTFYVEVGSRKNISGKKDGFYFVKHNKALKFGETFDRGLIGDLSFETGLSFGGEIELKFGAPGEAFNCGIRVTPTIGPKLSTTFLNHNMDDYDKAWHFGIPLSIDGVIFFNLIKGIEFDIDVAKYVANLLGKSEPTLYEFVPKDWRFYPSIDNMGIECTNPKDVGNIPKFKLRFDVEDGGLLLTKLNTAKPIIHIYNHNLSSSPIISNEGLNVLRYGKNNSYEWTFSDSKIKRDDLYDAEVVMIQPTSERVLYRKRYAFSSVSPSIDIQNIVITAQREAISEKPDKKGVYKTLYDWKFRTTVQFRGFKEVTAWGFTCGGKNYVVETPPTASSAVVLWALTNSQKSNRTLTFTPFVNYMVDGTPQIAYGAPYTVNLVYDPSKNSYNDQWDKTLKMYISGFDVDSEWGAPDVDMSKSKL